MSTFWNVGTSNAFSTTLSSSIAAGDTSIVLVSVTGLQAPGVLVIDRQDGNGNSTPTLREYISYTGIAGNTLTGCTRGRAGSTSQAHNAGAVVEEVMSIDHWADARSIFLTEHTGGGLHVIGTATINYTQTYNLAVTSIASIAQVSASGIYASLASIYQANIQNLTIVTSLNTSGASLILNSPIVNTPTLRTWDGWEDANESWSYASASTITVPTGAASKYQKGDRIKFTQTTIKYATIVAVADTLLTIAVNNDYVVTNAAITANFYSHEINPMGYPEWFNYTPTYTGWSVNPDMVHIYKITGRTFTMFSSMLSGGGTSNSTSASISIPVTAITIAGYNFVSWLKTMDNGSETTTPGESVIGSNSNAIVLRKTPGTNASWTASGGKAFWGISVCEF